MARKAGISLRTIAKATGVSVVTVSRALNRDFLVDPETAKKVELAALKLGYKLPSPERRSVRVSKGNIGNKPLRLGRLAFIIPDNDDRAFTTPLSRGIQKGISEYLFERKIELVSTHLDRGKQLPTVLAKKEVDGYILRGNFSDIPLTKREHSQMGRFPHVSIFGLSPINSPKGATQTEDYILPDDRLIGRIALDALTKAGSENPLLISTLPDKGMRPAQVSTFSRRNGFMYEAFSRELPYQMLEIPSVEKKAIIKTLRQHIKKSDKPTGIFLTRPFPEMLEALEELELTPRQGVPLYCSVSGKEDRVLNHGIHAIDLRPEALGKAAAELLIWRINHPELESKSVLIPPEMIRLKK